MNPERAKLSVVLFNPFVYVAGGLALLLGFGTILVAGLIGIIGRTHFDGVLDTHSGADAPVWLFLSEGFIDWFCLAFVLWLGGLLVSQTRFRAWDVFGTQALARGPSVLIALLTLPPGFQRFGAQLASQLRAGGQLVLNIPDALVFAFVVLAMLPLICWMVALMYNAFSVSCNVKGARAVVTFVIGLLVAEAVSKCAIIGLFKLSSI